MAFFRVASNQELVDFTKMLSVMLKSGITINEALAELSVRRYRRFDWRPLRLPSLQHRA